MFWVWVREDKLRLAGPCQSSPVLQARGPITTRVCTHNVAETK